MKSRRSQGSSPEHTPTESSAIGPGNWAELFAAGIRNRGGVGFVIRNQEPKTPGVPTPAEWNAWMGYFERHGISTKFMRYYGVVTTPTQWPEEFDLSEETSDRHWTFPSGRAYDPTMRVRVAALFRQLTREVDPGPDEVTARRRSQTKQDAARDVAAGFPHLQTPLGVSPRLRDNIKNRAAP